MGSSRGRLSTDGAHGLIGPTRTGQPTATAGQKGKNRFTAIEALRGNTVALTLLVFLAVAGFVAASWRPFSMHSLLDLDVYRSGGATWLAGHSLYDQLLPALTLHLPFTYPPFSAILMSPLALVGMPVAAMTMTLMSMVALTATGFQVCRTVALEAGAGWVPQLKPRLLSAVSLLIAIDVALLLEPIASTLSHGQINVLLMAMVIADATCTPGGRAEGSLLDLRRLSNLLRPYLSCIFCCGGITGLP